MEAQKKLTSLDLNYRPSRRTVAKGAAWSVPVVSLASAAPAFAGTLPPGTPTTKVYSDCQQDTSPGTASGGSLDYKYQVARLQFPDGSANAFVDPPAPVTGGKATYTLNFSQGFTAGSYDAGYTLTYTTVFVYPDTVTLTEPTSFGNTPAGWTTTGAWDGAATPTTAPIGSTGNWLTRSYTITMVLGTHYDIDPNTAGTGAISSPGFCNLTADFTATYSDTASPLAMQTTTSMSYQTSATAAPTATALPANWPTGGVMTMSLLANVDQTASPYNADVNDYQNPGNALLNPVPFGARWGWADCIGRPNGC